MFYLFLRKLIVNNPNLIVTLHTSGNLHRDNDSFDKIQIFDVLNQRYVIVKITHIYSSKNVTSTHPSFELENFVNFVARCNFCILKTEIYIF